MPKSCGDRDAGHFEQTRPARPASGWQPLSPRSSASRRARAAETRRTAGRPRRRRTPPAAASVSVEIAERRRTELAAGRPGDRPRHGHSAGCHGADRRPPGAGRKRRLHRFGSAQAWREHNRRRRERPDATPASRTDHRHPARARRPSCAPTDRCPERRGAVRERKQLRRRANRRCPHLLSVRREHPRCVRADRLRRARGVQPDNRPHLPDVLHERLATRLHRRQRRVCLFLRPRGRDELRHDRLRRPSRRAEHNLRFRREPARRVLQQRPRLDQRVQAPPPAVPTTCTTPPPRRTSAPAATTPPSTSRSSHGRGLAAAPTRGPNASSMTAGRTCPTPDAECDVSWDLRFCDGRSLTATRLRRAGVGPGSMRHAFLVGRKPLETGGAATSHHDVRRVGRSSPVPGISGSRRVWAATSRAG